MNIDDVIHDFAVAGNDLPTTAMRWALDNWDVAVPRFQELLERFADGADRSNESGAARRPTTPCSPISRLSSETRAGEARARIARGRRLTRPQPPPRRRRHPRG